MSARKTNKTYSAKNNEELKRIRGKYRKPTGIAPVKPAALVQKCLAQPITTVEKGGTKQTRTVFDVIVMRLLAKAAESNRGAIRALKMYKEYAAKIHWPVPIPEEDRQDAALLYAMTLRR